MSESPIQYPILIEEIRSYLPHRFPFLLIDRVLEIDAKGDITHPESSDDKVGTRVKALKNVTFNEPCFTGHFPEFSIFPGVLTLEAMAQASAFAAYPMVKANPKHFSHGVSVILLGIDQARFRKPVVPGDSLIIEATVKKVRKTLWSMETVATVNGQKVAEAELLANMGPRKPGSP